MTLEMLVEKLSTGDESGGDAGFCPVIGDGNAVTAGTTGGLMFSLGQTATARWVNGAIPSSAMPRTIDTLGGAMAHDFNNLLGVIIGNLVLADRMLGAAPDARELIAEAMDAASRGVALARNLLSQSRGQAAPPETLDLNEILSRMRRLIHRIVGDDVTIDFQFEPDLWPVVAEASQFESSLLNLAANARDAMAGSGTLTIKTENWRVDADFGRQHPSVRSGDYIRVSVDDTGCGMDAETLSQAFKPFFTTKEEFGGTGLGLSMVLDFVSRAGGHITARSAPGAGTTICLLLPRRPENGYFMTSAAVLTQPPPLS